MAILGIMLEFLLSCATWALITVVVVVIAAKVSKKGVSDKSIHTALKVAAAIAVLSTVARVVNDQRGPGSVRRGVDHAGTQAALQAQDQSIAPGDMDAITAFIDLPRRWNLCAAPLIRDYLDPSVSADQWVKEGTVRIGELRAIHMEMHACAFAIEDPGIRATLQGFSDNYGEKVGCLTALHIAVANEDPSAEQDALQAISEAHTEGQRLAQAYTDRMRPYVDPQALTEEFQKRGREMGELLKPRVH